MDAWEWTTPSLIDVGTGTVLDSQFEGRYEGQLAATTDGKSLFVADNPGVTSPVIVRYDVSSGKLQQASKSSSALAAGASVRTLLATPDAPVWSSRAERAPLARETFGEQREITGCVLQVLESSARIVGGTPYSNYRSGLWVPVEAVIG